MNKATAEAIAPFVIDGIEAAITAANPAVGAFVKAAMPAVAKVACILLCEDPATIKAELLAAQYAALDAAVRAQIEADPHV